jgi:hypothetical protein
MPEENNQSTPPTTPPAGGTPPTETKYSSKEWTDKFNSGGWIETLPADLAKEASLGKFVGKPPSEVAKSYVQLQKAFGDRVPKPKSEFSKAEWDEWNKNYNPGYPDTQEKYELPMPEDKKFTDQINPENIKKFKQLAYDNGLTVEQAKRLWGNLINEEHNQYKNILENSNKKINEDKAALKKEWGYGDILSEWF